MDYLFVRSRLQAIIAAQLLQDGHIGPRVHLVRLLEHADDGRVLGLDFYFERMRPWTVSSQTVVYTEVPFLRLCLLFFLTGLKSLLLRRRIWIAGLRWYPLALTLRLLPGVRIHTFDDGTANTQKRHNSYLADQPSPRPGPLGALARLLFPQGPSIFLRSRIAHHHTIYPDEANVVEPGRLKVVRVDWEALITTGDRAELPAGPVRRIFLGTAFAEARRVGMNCPETVVETALAWADLYIPHPREPSTRDRSPLFQKYPAEAIICHYARSAPVTVAHFNSSTALSLRGHAGVTLVDLSLEPLPARAGAT